MTETDTKMNKENSYTYWWDSQKNFYKDIEKPSTSPVLVNNEDKEL